jgi:hypothetical protein
MSDQHDVGRSVTQRDEEITQGIRFQLAQVADGFANGFAHGALKARHAARS